MISVGVRKFRASFLGIPGDARYHRGWDSDFEGRADDPLLRLASASGVFSSSALDPELALRLREANDADAESVSAAERAADQRLGVGSAGTGADADVGVPSGSTGAWARDDTRLIDWYVESFVWPRLKAATTVVDGWWEEEHQQQIVRAAMMTTNLKESAVQKFLQPVINARPHSVDAEAANKILRESRAVFVEQMCERVFKKLKADWMRECNSASSKLTRSDDDSLAAVLQVQCRCGAGVLYLAQNILCAVYVVACNAACDVPRG